MIHRPPSPTDELLFLTRMRAVLADGAFVSTYKFALLRALMDECVERPETLGRVAIPRARLGERFVELYWRQSRPFALGEERTGGPDDRLRQSTGKQAAVVRLLASEQARTPNLQDLRRERRRWAGLISKVTRIVTVMPLFKLQTIGGKKMIFLFPEDQGAREVTLLPGVAFLLRRHHGLLRDLVEMAWIRFIEALPTNDSILGRGQELGAFLFGAERRTLGRIGEVLRGHYGNRCFYCDREVDREAQVDHFIPWSRYGLDLGHNFVLCDVRCNLAKRTYLPAARHLARWLDRNLAASSKFARDLQEAGTRCDLLSTHAVAEWAYSVDIGIGASTWIGPTRRVEPAGIACAGLLANARAGS